MEDEHAYFLFVIKLAFWPPHSECMLIYYYLNSYLLDTIEVNLGIRYL